ncbi:MAG TPA: DNA-3-methyladenine glycosylase I [Candidatus Angelobacter sp.]|jgi:DNA-3-methyladenine glycosylase I
MATKNVPQAPLDERQRCSWATTPAMIAYHDAEWGVPQHDDRVLFEFLILEGAQAGLSWSTILAKRNAYRRAFSNFNPNSIARYDAPKLKQLMANAGIVRNRLKISAAVQNARAFLAVQKEFGTFDAYIWQFVGEKPIVNALSASSQIQARTEESDRMSRDLLKRGFKFVGPTICYAFMQAVGMVNDHLVTCFRYAEIKDAAARHKR